MISNYNTKWYVLVPESDLTMDMIHEAAHSINPDASAQYLIEMEKGLRKVYTVDSGYCFIVKLGTRFAPLYRNYIKLNRNKLETCLEELNHVERKHI